jgi:hypothetical protein
VPSLEHDTAPAARRMAPRVRCVRVIEYRQPPVLGRRQLLPGFKPGCTNRRALDRRPWPCECRGFATRARWI